MTQLSSGDHESAPECVKDAADAMPHLFRDDPAPGSLIALNGGALLQLLEAETSLRAMLLYRQMQLQVDEALRVES